MIGELLRRLPTLGRRGPGVVCAVCHAALEDEPWVRVHGTPMHRYCMGYRARQALRG